MQSFCAHEALHNQRPLPWLSTNPCSRAFSLMLRPTTIKVWRWVRMS